MENRPPFEQRPHRGLPGARRLRTDLIHVEATLRKEDAVAMTGGKGVQGRSSFREKPKVVGVGGGASRAGVEDALSKLTRRSPDQPIGPVPRQEDEGKV